MSRRHRGRPHHRVSAGADGPHRSPLPESTGSNGQESAVPRITAAAPPRAASLTEQRAIRSDDPRADRFVAPPGPGLDPSANGRLAFVDRASGSQAALTAVQSGPPVGGQNGERNGQCTAPQLRRFIKSRPYVPMHELRRRFSINGDDDEVTPVRIDPGWIYVGLPDHEGRLLGDLLSTGEIGYELSLDPRSPIVIGVYPMRPVPRS